ncbi:breast cancer metastasis-suppressor 1-like protein-A [Lingula anatina]|uniref:Breast cancer metastasis-suppressor 1-like protein-A n=1 Tax=Lingula anatina TaxID=7574 RepID=A0A1S3JBY7_LINAN|nr:breast cancer metastasis-suppressor 1-like protein-A [Lingula anatina]|eukprot:XP_013407838.1 breast cancer metastasis-suppressor 1-like protein-A [Lingula anatina]
MPSVSEKNETEDEEMEQESQDSDKSEDDESESGSGSEEGDEEESSELDEEECERRRDECLDDMLDLEKQFSDLKEQLHGERMSQVDAKLEEVHAGLAHEYLSPLDELQENMRIRTEVAGIWRELELENIRNKYECEMQAAQQNFESEKIILYDTVKAELEEKIRRLEEDRHNIDISSDLWNESQNLKRNKRKVDPHNPDRRRKPITVSGPYIVYMLKDMDIIEDWTAIKKALKQQSQKRKAEHILKKENHPFNARFDDGKLFYEGEWYNKGHHIIIDNKEDSPVHATVTAINTGEVWVKRSDGNKSKLYIAQLQKGKYTIRHVPY